MSTTHRSRYSPRKRVALKFEDHSLAKQASKDECDINLILRRHAEGNMLTHVNNLQGQFGDFSDVTDYHTSLGRVLEAQEAFASLPSNIRARFNHDPGALLAFLDDDSNRPEAEALGLVQKPHLEPSSPLSGLSDGPDLSPSKPKAPKQSSTDER